jgi:two-component system, OmpR family, response regulator
MNSKMRVLLIDDNKDITDTVSFYLDTQGIQCKIINDGKKGLEIIRSENFDVILVDLAMPEFSGFDIVSTLNKEGLLKFKNILLFTASSVNSKDIIELLSMGAKGVVKKPPSIDELLEAINKFAS